MNISDVSKRVSQFAQENSPAILTAVGVVGTVTAAYLTGKATIKAVKAVRLEEDYRGLDHEMNEQLPASEIVRICWRFYIPPASAILMSTVAIIAANRVSSKRVASVATALAIGEKAFSEYKDKVVEKIGENKERGIHDSIAQDHVTKNPPDDRLVIITDNGHVLCRDEYSGRYFRSSMEEINRAVNDINRRLMHDGDISLTEFYDLLGLPKTSHSDDVGWNYDGEGVSVRFSAAVTKDEKPCICFTFVDPPTPAFYRSSR